MYFIFSLRSTYIHAEYRLVSRAFTFCVSISPMSSCFLKMTPVLRLPGMDLLLRTLSFVFHLARLQPSTIIDDTTLTLLEHLSRLVCISVSASRHFSRLEARDWVSHLLKPNSWPPPRLCPLPDALPLGDVPTYSLSVWRLAWCGPFQSIQTFPHTGPTSSL